MSDTDIDLRTAAARLGVHYQTAYQWVRSGRLPARRIGGRYTVRTADVDRLARDRSRPQPPRVRRPRRGFPAVARNAHRMLVGGDERSLRALVGSLRDDGVTMTTVIEQVLAPALARIGADWHAGRADIATEHRASGIVERLLGEYMPRPRGRRRGTVVVAALTGDRHALPAAMAATALREDGWTVEYLGADLPPDEILRFADANEPALVVLTVTNPACAARANELAAELADHDHRVVVGSPGRTLTDLQLAAIG